MGKFDAFWNKWLRITHWFFVYSIQILPYSINYIYNLRKLAYVGVKKLLVVCFFIFNFILLFILDFTGKHD